MIFTPTKDENAVISLIHQFINSDYAIIRVTPTMADKNIIDANGNFRRIMEDANLIKYDKLANGKRISYPATFIQSNKTTSFKLNMYKASKRGDRRFSIGDISNKVKNHEIELNDLLYIFITTDCAGEKHIYMINTTHNIPSSNILKETLGEDAISTALEELLPTLRHIIHNGPYENCKGEGKIAPKDAGDTFEALVGIETNNNAGADYKGLIEFKTKRSNTMDTLFTLRPCFEGTPIAEIEPVDRKRVSAFAREYGYESDNHPGMKSLYITIAAQPSPRNNQNFYLAVNYDKKRVELLHIEENKDVLTAFWDFNDLRSELAHKHPSTLWINTTVELEGSNGITALFKYNSISFSRSPNFTTFLTMIEIGAISYDWRGYTTPEGNYSGKNHGNAWRINKSFKDLLFESLIELDL
ncbi:hypothetical protein NZ47_10940 [Anaerovibrio lipolyticus]|uniref:MvaI/BcnI restriction endonuclease domain-containing protein n=1 Tax=Anaerovibrio lipolyticus TaxID=82374 RepID=A0A0B2JXJ0_9FIRM|nr:MvaI/BcnI family restriction endonuclease [Anaerovibrio lipolyticus]KHM51361.1 hypothetical protein NZ47_10940 [Anaerovibrio lipolyticus]